MLRRRRLPLSASAALTIAALASLLDCSSVRRDPLDPAALTATLDRAAHERYISPPSEPFAFDSFRPSPPPFYALWQDACAREVQLGLPPPLSASGLTEAVDCIDAYSLVSLGTHRDVPARVAGFPPFRSSPVRAFASVADPALISSIVGVLDDPFSYGCRDALCCHPDLALTLHLPSRTMNVLACVGCGHVLILEGGEYHHMHLSLWGIASLAYFHNALFPDTPLLPTP